jgi:hypothetical protein
VVRLLDEGVAERVRAARKGGEDARVS